MSLKNKEKAAILFKSEASYGVDSLPLPGTDTFICSKPEFGVISEERERKVVLPYFGKLASLKVGTGLEVSFEVEVKGSGVVATAPMLGRLLRCCNFSQTITPAVKVEYALLSTLEGESGTCYVYQDGFLHKLLGCVGDLTKWANKTNDTSTAGFKFTALYSGAVNFATEATFPALTFAEAAVVPPFFRNSAFTIHGYAAVIENFNFQLGNEIGKRLNSSAATGIDRYFIKNRAMKGDCDPEAAAYADFNPWQLWEDGTSGALFARIGSVAGNIIEIDMPGIVAGEVPKYGDREGLLTYAYGFGAHPTLTQGNQELKITFK